MKINIQVKKLKQKEQQMSTKSFQVKNKQNNENSVKL